MKKNKLTDLIPILESSKVQIINDLVMIMKHKKIKRRVLCSEIGISYTFLSDVLNMKKNPSYDTLILIAKGVGANVRIILEY